MRRAVFLDRDGTLIEQVHHLNDPSQVRLLPSVGQSIRQLRGHGYACVVVTNQSGIGRGLQTVSDLLEVYDEIVRQLRAYDATLDGWYYCPAVPKSRDRTQIEYEERKPGPGLLIRAAQELSLELSRSWMVGDMISDVLAGRNAGCLGTVLVRTGYGRDQPQDHEAIDFVVDSLKDAVQVILEQDDVGSAAPRSPTTAMPFPRGADKS